MRKIIALILSVTMLASVLSGCVLITDNTEKNIRQVVATIASVSETHTVNGVSDTYTTERRDIYKSELLTAVNNNYKNLVEQNLDLKQIVEYCLTNLINMQLIVNEVDIRMHFGDIKWTQKDDNDVKKAVYASIDASLLSIMNAMLSGRDEPELITETTNDSQTTYPLPPVEEDDDEDKPDEDPWSPNLVSYPGLYGSDEKKSLEREAFTRLIATINENTKDDFRATAEDKRKFKEDNERINGIINTLGLPYVYPILSETHMVWWLIGRNAENSQKITLAREYITKSVTVTDAQVRERFNALLSSQVSSFSDVSLYSSAINSGDTILYHASSNYFYVKHILISFSDAQKAQLAEYKKRPGLTDKQIENFKLSLVPGIVSYPHINGEDDTTRPMTVGAIFNHIKSVMNPVANNPYEAERAFDSLIYLYNTDPGIFDRRMGYIVQHKLGEGDTETYMQEFADGARLLRETKPVGSVLDNYVVTDHGVHILYLANVFYTGQKMGINDPTTPGRYQTYYELLEEEIRNNKENEAYSTWEREKISYYENKSGVITKYESRIKDIWEK